MKAVVLFNLGGPDSLKSVKPFLFNLFYDPHILRIPNPMRYMLAKFISSRRANKARAIYQRLGGKSPIVEETAKQAVALQAYLGEGYKVFISMRYWNPSAEELISKIAKNDYEEIILVPLYPQFSTSTTGSFYYYWDLLAKKYKIKAPTRKICCYFNNPLFIKAHREKIIESLKDMHISKLRFLFSAHGLPKGFIEAGDPYQYQVQSTVRCLLEICPEIANSVISYQSRVGPRKWLEPSTESEIIKAGQEQVPIVIVPISFVSEHAETLDELDYTYKNLAQSRGVPAYYRVPALGTQNSYIRALADSVTSKIVCSCEAAFCKIIAINGNQT